MPLKIKHVKQEEAPKPSSTGKANTDLFAVKSEMLKLGKGMVLEIETGSAKAVRGTKDTRDTGWQRARYEMAALARRNQGIREARRDTKEGHVSK